MSSSSDSAQSAAHSRTGPKPECLRERLNELATNLVNVMNLVGCVADAAGSAEVMNYKIEGSLRIAENLLREHVDEAVDQINMDMDKLLPEEASSA